MAAAISPIGLLARTERDAIACPGPGGGIDLVGASGLFSSTRIILTEPKERHG
jgi:hypothetical protein